MSWKAERFYWAALCMVSFAVIAQWSYQLGRQFGGLWQFGLLLCASAISISTLGTAVSLGQFTVLILACIIGAWQLDDWACKGSGGKVLSFLAILAGGLLLGIGMSKPQLTAPFVLLFLIRRRFGLVACLAGYIVVASAVIWAVTKTDPVEMIQQMMYSASIFAGAGYGPAQLFARYGVPLGLTMKMTGVLMPIAAGIVMWVWRRSSVPSLMAVAGVAARLWTYHPQYDNGLLIFLLIALGIEAASQTNITGQRVLWTTFFIIGLTLWPRPKICLIPIYQNFQLFSWFAAPILLFVFSSKNRHKQTDVEAEAHLRPAIA